MTRWSSLKPRGVLARNDYRCETWRRSPALDDPVQSLMQDVFLVCLALGAFVLVVQIVLDLFGVGQSHDITLAGEGLDLLSVRTISAGAVLFGAVGLWLSSTRVPALVVAPAAFMAGGAAAVASAYLTRQFLRLESSGSLQLENAVGQLGTVYLPIPPRRQGFGRVQFTLQGRTVELRAVADEKNVLPTGAAIIVVSVIDGDTVEVTPIPQLEGIDA
jgi:hypothetical protein